MSECVHLCLHMHQCAGSSWHHQKSHHPIRGMLSNSSSITMPSGSVLACQGEWVNEWIKKEYKVDTSVLVLADQQIAEIASHQTALNIHQWPCQEKLPANQWAFIMTDIWYRILPLKKCTTTYKCFKHTSSSSAFSLVQNPIGHGTSCCWQSIPSQCIVPVIIGGNFESHKLWHTSGDWIRFFIQWPVCAQPQYVHCCRAATACWLLISNWDCLKRSTQAWVWASWSSNIVTVFWQR